MIYLSGNAMWKVANFKFIGSLDYSFLHTDVNESDSESFRYICTCRDQFVQSHANTQDCATKWSCPGHSFLISE